MDSREAYTKQLYEVQTPLECNVCSARKIRRTAAVARQPFAKKSFLGRSIRAGRYKKLEQVADLVRSNRNLVRCGSSGPGLPFTISSLIHDLVLHSGGGTFMHFWRVR